MENWLQSLQVRWLDRLQSRLVLPTARTLYLGAAILCVVAALGGLAFALVFQFGAWQSATKQPVPQLVSAQPSEISFNRLDQRFSPPSNIRFVVDLPSLPSPLSADTPLGHFEADTPNGLAAYPDDFQIIGGKDAALFDEGQDFSQGPHTVLRAKPALADEINKIAPSLKASAERTFTIQVLAHDRYGSHSVPSDVSFTLSYGPPSTTPAQSPVIEEVQPRSAILKNIAMRIAAIVDPTHGTPAYFDAYNYALAEPARCNASGNDAFITNYGRALNYIQARLTKDNLTPFYTAVCEAWADAVKQGADAAAKSLSDQLQAIAANDAAEARATALRAVSRTGRNAALVFTAGALVAFMTIALSLAFLAIEGHSNAVRHAIEAITAQRLGQDVPPTAPPEVAQAAE